MTTFRELVSEIPKKYRSTHSATYRGGVKPYKLTGEHDYEMIRSLWATGYFFQKDLAAMFDVTTPRICQITKGKK
jgi:hypothetical protein